MMTKNEVPGKGYELFVIEINTLKKYASIIETGPLKLSQAFRIELIKTNKSLKELSGKPNPKTWFGIDLLATYGKVKSLDIKSPSSFSCGSLFQDARQ